MSEPRVPKRERRRLALAQLVMDVACSYAVTAPGTGDGIAAKYDLSPEDMAKLYEVVGDRLEAWSLRLGYDRIPLDGEEQPR